MRTPITDGDLDKSRRPTPSVANMIGKTFSRWTIKEFAGWIVDRPYVIALCTCGSEGLTGASHILYGNSKSCGCLSTEIHTRRLTIHGYAPLHGKRKKSYKAWQGMRARCYDSKNSHFKHYGGRGIKVCERWKNGENGLNGFQCFLEDMGEPEAGLSLERVDFNGNYCPENCTWIPWRDQAKNRRHNWSVTMGGELMTVAECARRIGVRPQVLNSFLRKNGFSKEDHVSLENIALKIKIIHNGKMTQLSEVLPL